MSWIQKVYWADFRLRSYKRMHRTHVHTLSHDLPDTAQRPERQGVAKRMKETGSGTRGSGEPAPYSAVCAYQEETTLHVIEGSHKILLKDEFSWADAKELKIPRGWGLVFHSCLVHAGASYVSVNGRIHLYLKLKNGLASFNGKIKTVKSKGIPPRAKLPKVGGGAAGSKVC
ncbi:unnamed protein product [Ectocarpus sp. 12 AP-2014]